MSTESIETCPSCGAARAGEYCSSCGERRLRAKEFSAGRFLAEFAASITSADSRLWRSAGNVLGRPGYLTAAAMRGVRSPYLRPIQVFLLANVLVLLLQPWLSDSKLGTDDGYGVHEFFGASADSVRERLAQNEEAFRALYSREANRFSRFLFFVLIPLQAILSWALHLRSRRPFGIYLTLSSYFLAFYLLVPDALIGEVHEAVVMGIARPGWEIVYDVGNVTRFVLPLLVSCWWLAGAERRVFGATPLVATAKGVLGGLLFVFVAVVGFRVILFFVTLASLAP